MAYSTMNRAVADLENEKGRIQTLLAITRLAWLPSARYNYYTRLCHGCGNVRLTLVRASKNALRRPDLVN